LDRLITELQGFDRIYPGHGDSGNRAFRVAEELSPGTARHH
jgi:hypothetical protein